MNFCGNSGKSFATRLNRHPGAIAALAGGFELATDASRLGSELVSMAVSD